MPSIKHVWFDLDGTLVVHTPEFERVHNELRYNTYAEAIGKSRSPDLEQEYEKLYKQCGSNSAAFRSLGLPSDYWSLRSQGIDPEKFYEPVPAIYETLEKLAAIVPISLFTNSKPASISHKLRVVRINEGLFTHIIDGDSVAERKPALEGFRLIVEKSQMPAESILFVGDRMAADIQPAKQVGMQACLVWADSAEADYSVRDFRDLLTIVS